MSISFKEEFSIPLIPSTPSQTAFQALFVKERVDHHNTIEEAKLAAVQAILNTTANDPPSELKRLRLLYQKVYTKSEMMSLVSNHFELLHIDKF